MNKKQINRILSSWNVGKLISYQQTTAGAVNINWIVRTTKGKYILRKVAFKNLKELKFKLSYLTYLKNRRFPYKVPTPLLTKKRKYIVRFNGFNFWLYDYIQGSIKARFGHTELREVAKALATYHKLIEKSSLDRGKGGGSTFNRKPVLKELNMFKSKVLKNPKPDAKDNIFFKEAKVLVPLLESLNGKEYSNLKRFPIHRDINPENTLWRGTKLVGIIDWENVSGINDTIIKDIVGMLQYSCRNKTYKYKTDLNLAKFCLREYKKYHHLCKDEIRFIPDVITAGAIEDFSYAYWQLVHDPKRAKLYRLKLYSKVAVWHNKNKVKIIEALAN